MSLLPTEPTPPVTSLQEQLVLVYGREKIGKTTLCSGAPGAIFVDTEGGTRNVEVHRGNPDTWNELLAMCAALKEEEHSFETVVIDTVDEMYRLCRDHYREKLGVEYLGDTPNNRGWSIVNTELRRVLTKLRQLPMGLILVSHAQDVDFKTTQGVKYSKTVPTLTNSNRSMVLGMCDLVLFCDIETTDKGERRIIRTKPSESYEAGDRTGKLPATIDLNWAALVKAYNGGGK